MGAKIHSVSQNYGVRYWGEGHFGINNQGHVSVCPRLKADEELDLYQLAQEVRQAGLRWPVLLRFNDILQQRVHLLCNAFRRAAQAIAYSGEYRAIYPIKVNQQRSVVEQIVAAGADCVGLEAGSKPELMAVLASAKPGSVVVCNGYKDSEYIRLALISQYLGYQVYIVLEKPSELALVVRESQDLNIKPLLGVRVRLSATASGKWQNSGGAKSKFGLSAAQLLTLIEQLQDTQMLSCLRLLHSHIGSQIPDLADIGSGVAEAARYYVALCEVGAPLEVLDVGGGLGVDYEGSSSTHYCSMNYDMPAYAHQVLEPIAQQCRAADIAMPMVFSESGRALTAHHAVLVTEIIEREPPSTPLDINSQTDQHPLVKALSGLRHALGEAAPLSLWQQAQHQFQQIQQSFAQGELSLGQRAHAERLFYDLATVLREHLRPGSRRHRELLDTLNDMLAERVFGNFSVFQSIPDTWAIGQVFPVMPLHRLQETPGQSASLQDLTCDSDGCIKHYVEQDGVESTLQLHADNGEPYLLGIFLVGAYQEILGDMHNLFGDTDAVNIELDGQGGYHLAEPEQGDTMDELLRYVHFDPQQMLKGYQEKLQLTGLAQELVDSYFAELEGALQGFTYLSRTNHGDARPL
jgi:arginine decarboxylase